MSLRPFSDGLTGAGERINRTNHGLVFTARTLNSDPFAVRWRALAHFLTCVYFKDKLLIHNFFSHLQALPQWVRMINDTQMDSGEKLQWECKAIGRPRPTYRWLRNGLPLTSQVPIFTSRLPFFCTVEYVNYSCGSAHPLCAALSCKWCLHSERMFLYSSSLFQSRLETVNGELSILKVQQADSGMYQCVAENKYGAIYSNAELKILGMCTCVSIGPKDGLKAERMSVNLIVLHHLCIFLHRMSAKSKVQTFSIDSWIRYHMIGGGGGVEGGAETLNCEMCWLPINGPWFNPGGGRHE